VSPIHDISRVAGSVEKAGDAVMARLREYSATKD
jgi:hypothetical protein